MRVLGKKRKIILRFYKMFAILVIFSIFAVILDTRIRPVVKRKVADCAKTDTTIILNQTLLKEIERLGISYADLSNITRAEDNSITSIEVNSLAVNSFKAILAISVSNALEKIDQFEFSVALGTLLGPEMLNETGPRIPFKVSSSGFVDTEIISDFKEAGINQTVHRILLSVKTNVSCYFPGYFVSTNVEMELTLAETVIIGQVPRYFGT